MAAIEKVRTNLYKKVRKLVTGKKEEEGASLAEYGLLVALIALACIAAITAVGGRLNVVFEQIRDALPAGGGT